MHRATPPRRGSVVGGRRGRRIRPLDPGAGVRPRAAPSTTSPSARPRARCRPRPGSRCSSSTASRRSRTPTPWSCRASATTAGRSPARCSTPCGSPRRAAHGSPRSAPARSCWAPPGCSTGAARPRTGPTRAASPVASRPWRSIRDVLYVDDGDVLTSAGVAAGIDLCLHMVRCDHGAEAANAVARRIVVARAPRGRAGAVRRAAADRGAERRPRGHARVDARAPRRAAHRRRHGPPRRLQRAQLRPPLPGRDRHLAAAVADRPARRARAAAARGHRPAGRARRRARRLRHGGGHAPALRARGRPPPPRRTAGVSGRPRYLEGPCRPARAPERWSSWASAGRS